MDIRYGLEDDSFINFRTCSALKTLKIKIIKNGAKITWVIHFSLKGSVKAVEFGIGHTYV